MRLLVAAALAAVVSISAVPAVAQSAFDGVYIGAAVGRDAAQMSFSNGVSSVDGSAVGIRGGLFGGYGRTFGSFYVGGEAAYYGSDGDGSSNIGAAGARYEMPHTFQLTGRAGYLLTPNVMAYGLLGWERGLTDVSITGIGRDRDHADALRTGLGIEYVVPQVRGAFVRAEADVALYGREGSLRTTGVTNDMQRSSVMLGVGYRF